MRNDTSRLFWPVAGLWIVALLGTNGAFAEDDGEQNLYQSAGEERVVVADDEGQGISDDTRIRLEERFRLRDERARAQAAEMEERVVSGSTKERLCSRFFEDSANLEERGALRTNDGEYRRYAVLSSSLQVYEEGPGGIETTCEAYDLASGEAFSFVQRGAFVDGEWLGVCGDPPICTVGYTYSAVFHRDLEERRVIRSVADVVTEPPACLESLEGTHEHQ